MVEVAATALFGTTVSALLGVQVALVKHLASQVGALSVKVGELSERVARMEGPGA